MLHDFMFANFFMPHFICVLWGKSACLATQAVRDILALRYAKFPTPMAKHLELAAMYRSTKVAI